MGWRKREGGGGVKKLRMTGVEIRQNADILRLRTKRGNDLVVVYIREPSAFMTLLYSHGRSEEKVKTKRQNGNRGASSLGQMYDSFSETKVITSEATSWSLSIFP